MPTGWKLFALGSAFFAGLTAILAKVGVRDLPSNLATLIRVFVIFPFLILIVWLHGEWRPLQSLSHRTIIFLILSGLATGLSWICYFRALQLGPASMVSSIDKLSLLIAVVLSVIFLNEKLNAWQWTGVAFMVVAAILLGKK